MEAEEIARRIATRVCSALKAASKVDLRVGLQTKILVHGELVKDEVASEFRKHFTEEERGLVRGELERILRPSRWRLT